ncbi:rhodanese-like domain-containing protein [Botrimarina sp.]|uniref:MBL fold metallo-hydrolase n=1 Tax=Botrimarina sp. TaxID=2795802 RepID=UPI0032EB8C6B
MTMVFQRVETQGIAQLSYLIGDDSSGTAAVIDPRPSVDVYLELARRYGVAITHVFETHIHADFMSGARELVHRLGGAQLCASGEAKAEYGFDVEKVHDGDRFDFGAVALVGRHTPGHTPEHLSYEIHERSKGENSLWGVFTGDSLFVGSAGRPDLLGEEQTDELVQQLFATLRDYFLKLDDGVILYPCHGAGSACGADIGERPMSTVGYERRTNPFLHHADFQEFKAFVAEGAPPAPHHYKPLKKLNAEGPPVLSGAPRVRGLPAERFAKACDRGDAQLVDTRQMLGFGGGHIEGAMNLGPRPELSVWAGQMLEHDTPILLVVEDESDLDWFLWSFANTGFTKFAGYLAGGMAAWENAGLPLKRTPQMSVHELKEHLQEVQVLDVRAPDEWQGGHIPGARRLYVADMRDGVNGGPGLDKQKPVVAYCGSGYRASIAASLLERAGYRDVRNVPGSFQAWKASGYEVVS